MLPSRTPVLLLSALALAACGAAEAVPPVAPVPLEEPADAVAPEPAPPPEPEPSLQERWRSPFAVTSRGRAAPRPERVVFVRGSETVPATAAPTAVAEEEDGERGAEPREAEAPAAPRPAALSPAPPPVRAEGAGSRTHEVAWGETWYGIARRYEIAPSALAAANPDANPERLRSGQVLRIPTADAPAPGERTHRVGSGDSLWGIARRYGVTMEQIRAANRMKDDRVRLGQTLIIPSAEESR